jgi:hypothetical protein
MAASLQRTAPQPRDVSPWVRIIIGGVLFVAAAIFILALRHPRQAPRLRDLTAAGDKWWTREARPTPAPTPRAQPVAVTRPLIFQARPAAKPTPPLCQICIERLMRYRRAIEVGMGMGSSASNTWELAQRFNPVPTPQATPEPLVIQEK